MKFDIVVILVMQLLANTIPIQCLGHTWYPVCVDGWHEGLLYRGKIFVKLKISHFSHFGPIHERLFAKSSQAKKYQNTNNRINTAKCLFEGKITKFSMKFDIVRNYPCHATIG